MSRYEKESLDSALEKIKTRSLVGLCLTIAGSAMIGADFASPSESHGLAYEVIQYAALASGVVTSVHSWGSYQSIVDELRKKR